MAAALQPLHNNPTVNALYPRAIMAELDYRDNRYPSLPQSRQSQLLSTSNDAQLDRISEASSQKRPDIEPQANLTPSWFSDASQPARRSSSKRNKQPHDTSTSANNQASEPHRSSLSYALPASSSRRVVERYSLDGDDQQTASKASTETRPTLVESQADITNARSRPGTPQASRVISSAQERERQRLSPIPRAPVSPQPEALPSGSLPTSQLPPIMPLSASPTYAPPVSPNHRAYPQHPTYVTQSNTPNPMQPVYTPIIPQQEDPCIECSMRDQDMADVDVTSPGAWDRASDVLFEELKQRELEDEANGVVIDDPSRPRIRGGRLTEQNLKIWLSINPREPTSRQHTLNAYIKSQRSLLEAEALAHARAMKEAKQLDNRMRDTYSQLRRSAYDMGTSSSPTDDLGGVRIKASPYASPKDHGRSRSREVTLLENGMIVEHVDVRKEEKEARERKKKEERRARKSSRSSVMDVTSVNSAQSGGPMAENSLKPYSRYSHASSARPVSVLTAPLDRPELPRAYSQASFSDVHSLGSSSPRKTRFFGIKNLSAGWRSQDSLAPSGISGSMLDMHVALQRENLGHHPLTASPIDLNTPRRSQIWPPPDAEDQSISHTILDEKTKKKKGGLAKIWRIVTGKHEQPRPEIIQVHGDHDDGSPLTPPPPLSYLVARGPSDLQSGGNMRHSSNPSLPSIASPKFGLSSPGMSPPTAPSSLLPSPISMRPYGLDSDVADIRPLNDGNPDEQHSQDDTLGKNQGGNMRSIQSAASELDLRLAASTSLPPSPLPNSSAANGVNRPMSLFRDKSLPPIPPGESPAQVLPSDLRPRTLYALPPGSSPPHDFLPPQAPFRTVDTRRQSFGGTSSRPNISHQTMPASRTNGFDGGRTFGPRYDDFGSSRRSLKLEHVDEHPRSTSPMPSTKRKSKFGFSSLLGKKDKREPESEKHQFPTMNYPAYDTQDDLVSNGYANSTSRHSAFSTGNNNPNLRMSVTSRKALEDLVQQDPEFVAYRYPSNDQRLDLLR